MKIKVGVMGSAGDAPPAGGKEALVEKAKEHCLLTNSLKAAVTLETTIHFDEPAYVSVA